MYNFASIIIAQEMPTFKSFDKNILKFVLYCVIIYLKYIITFWGMYPAIQFTEGVKMVKKKRFTVKKLLKYIALLLILIVYVLLIGRMALAKVSGDMARYLWTESGALAYKSSPKDYKIQTAYITAVIDEDTGYYHISNFTFVKGTGEVQLTIRYNDSTVDELDKFYPNREKTPEDFVFVISDDYGNVYDTYKYISSSNLLYNFRRVVFENVDLETDSSLYLSIYYIGDVSLDCPMTRRYKLIDSELLSEAGYIKNADVEIDYKNTAPHRFKLSPDFETDVTDKKESLQ